MPRLRHDERVSVLIITHRSWSVAVKIERASADSARLKWKAEVRPHTCFKCGRSEARPRSRHDSEVGLRDRLRKVVRIDAWPFAQSELRLFDERTHSGADPLEGSAPESFP